MATLPPDADSFAAKSEEALRFLASHPDLYHPDVVAAARRELQRRGRADPGAGDAPRVARAVC